MTQEEKAQILFQLSTASNISSEYLFKLTDKELKKLYNEKVGGNFERG